MGGEANLDLLHCLAEHLQAKSIIETGVAYGWSSLALLLSLWSRRGAKLVSTDMPYPFRGNDRHVGCVVPSHLREAWTVLSIGDRIGIPRAVKMLGSVDLCHYDGDKTYEGRRRAYPLRWNALRPGGLLVSDDIGDNAAFKEFVELTKAPVTVVSRRNRFAGILKKVDNQARLQ